MKANPHRQARRRADQAGFSLIEIVISIGVVAVTFIGIIGLLGLGMANDQTSTQQTVATNIVSSIVTDLRSTPANVSPSVRYKLTIPATGPLTTTPSYYLYFDNSSNCLPLGTPIAYGAVQNPPPTGAAYAAAVYLADIAPAVGSTNQPTPDGQITYAVRVVVSWPAKTAAGAAVGGNVDVLTEYQVH